MLLLQGEPKNKAACDRIVGRGAACLLDEKQITNCKAKWRSAAAAGLNRDEQW